MERREQMYLLFFGITLYLVVVSGAGLLSTGVFILSGLALKSTMATLLVTGIFRLLAFAALASLSPVLLLGYLRPRPATGATVRRPPAALFIVLLCLMPVLFVLNLLASFAEPLVIHRMFEEAAGARFIGAERLMQVSFTFLNLCLVAALSIIVILKSKQPAPICPSSGSGASPRNLRRPPA